MLTLNRLIEMADRALRGDLQAGDDLGSIRATQILLDAANNDAAIAAINYTGATTAADKASAASKLYASINDSLKIGAAYAEMTRVAGQRLRIAQMDADPNILNSKLIPGVNLQHATTEAAGKAALKEGLQPTAGPLATVSIHGKHQWLRKHGWLRRRPGRGHAAEGHQDHGPAVHG